MPSRRALPELPIFSRRSATSSDTFSSASRHSITIPMTPPARLHLRNLLPSSPDGMPTPPPPPRQPYPWLWQCHSCSTVYRIGCTRRCLVCSHEFCVSANPSSTRRGRKRRRTNGMCASEFDYNGWAEWGAWRRKVLGLEVTGRIEKLQRERAFIERAHNCLVDCDYPSECHHERYRLRTEGLEENMLGNLTEEPTSPPIVAGAPLNPDDELPLNEALELQGGEDEKDEQRSPTSPKRQKWDRKSDPPQKDQVPARTEQDESHEASSFAIEAGTMDLEALYRLVAEDEDMMPIDNGDGSDGNDNGINTCAATSSTGSRIFSRRNSEHDGKLTVRNRSDANSSESRDNSPDGDSDSRCSSLSSGSEWVPACDSTPASEVSSDEDGDRDEEGQDRDMRVWIETGRSFLRD
ncbi:hypothetical protein AAE478_005244 [Parahypoxylon ruwenzoriense]